MSCPALWAPRLHAQPLTLGVHSRRPGLVRTGWEVTGAGSKLPQDLVLSRLTLGSSTRPGTTILSHQWQLAAAEVSPQLAKAGLVTLELPSLWTVALVAGGLIGGTVLGVAIAARVVGRALEQGPEARELTLRTAAQDAVTALRDVAPAVGLIITLSGGFLSLSNRVESLELKVDAQNTRIDAQNARIDAQNTRIDALNVRAEAELRTLADQTAALRAYNDQIFRLALRQAQESQTAS